MIGAQPSLIGAQPLFLCFHAGRQGRSELWQLRDRGHHHRGRCWYCPLKRTLMYTLCGFWSACLPLTSNVHSTPVCVFQCTLGALSAFRIRRGEYIKYYTQSNVKCQPHVYLVAWYVPNCCAKLPSKYPMQTNHVQGNGCIVCPGAGCDLRFCVDCGNEWHPDKNCAASV